MESMLSLDLVKREVSKSDSLHWISQTYNGRVRTGFIRPRIGSRGGHFANVVIQRRA